MEEMKVFSVRIPKKDWILFKKYCIEQETSMNKIIQNFFDKMKKKLEKSVDIEC